MASSFVTSRPILKWPQNVKPNSMELHQQANTARFSSPFTRTTQTQELPGGVFALSATFPPLNREKAAAARAFIARLRGSAGRFYFPVSDKCDFAIPDAGAAEETHKIPLLADLTAVKCDNTRITIDATEIIEETIFTPDGSGTATTINGTLWVNSGLHPLEPGNYLSFDDADGWRHLHMIVDVEYAPEAGYSTITVEPPMRSRPTSSTPIHVSDPSGVFMLNDDNQGSMTMSPGQFGNLSIDATQAFPLKVIV